MTRGVISEFGVEFFNFDSLLGKVLNKLGSRPFIWILNPMSCLQLMLATLHADTNPPIKSHQKEPKLRNLIYKYHSIWKTDP